MAYVREHDEAGEGRWVLERRRTAESGELELVGREIVEGMLEVSEVVESKEDPEWAPEYQGEA